MPLFNVRIAGSRDVYSSIQVEADNEDDAENQGLSYAERNINQLDWEDGDIDDGIDIDSVDPVEEIS